MLLQEIPLFRILQVFILQLGLGIYFFVIGLLILKRSRKRLNVILSLFFLFTFCGTLLNVIYALMTDIPLITMLSHITVFFLYFALIFLLVFNLIIIKSQKIFNTRKQLIVICGYGALIAVTFFIPGGLTITAENDYVPFWSLTFFLYSIIVTLSIAVIPGLVTSILVYKKFEDLELKKKWRFYFLGIIAHYIAYFEISVANYLNDPTIRLVFNALALILFIATYFVYYGVIRQLKEE